MLESIEEIKNALMIPSWQKPQGIVIGFFLLQHIVKAINIARQPALVGSTLRVLLNAAGVWSRFARIRAKIFQKSLGPNITSAVIEKIFAHSILKTRVTKKSGLWRI